MQNVLLKKLCLFLYIIYASHSVACSQGYSYTPQIKQADSLFAGGDFTGSLEMYEQVLSQSGKASPGILLKIAYIQEGLKDYTKALYYLSLYYSYKPSGQIIDRMKDIASEHKLKGYEFEDVDFFMVLYERYYVHIALILLLICFISLASLASRKIRRQYVPTRHGIGLILLIHHGDTLLNDWEILNEMNPAKKLEFDAIVANPPFSLRWEPSEAMGEDFRFKSYGLAPKSAADFAFLLHGFHFLSKEGTMAIILPHGVLFRGGSEERIRTKLLKDDNIDTVIGLPANLFFSTGIPVCILVLKKCKKFDDVLFINAVDHFEKGKRQNNLLPENIEKIIETYRERKEETRYSRRVSMDEIKKNEFNLNISRYISTSLDEEIIDLNVVNQKLVDLDKDIIKARETHNQFLMELGLPPI